MIIQFYKRLMLVTGTLTNSIRNYLL